MEQVVAHQRAQDAFGAVLANVTDDQLDAPTPCSEWRVRDLIAHVSGGNYRVAGSVPPSPTDLPGLVEAFAVSARRAQDSFSEPDGLTRTIEMSIGSLPAKVVIGMRTTEVLAHAWDLARATGQPTDIDPELAAAALTASKLRFSDDLRGPGQPFGQAQPSDQDCSAADRLAAFLGRAID
jgi:uncharacterized protein (TIGR03086 family)